MNWKANHVFFLKKKSERSWLVSFLPKYMIISNVIKCNMKLWANIQNDVWFYKNTRTETSAFI